MDRRFLRNFIFSLLIPFAIANCTKVSLQEAPPSPAQIQKIETTDLEPLSVTAVMNATTAVTVKLEDFGLTGGWKLSADPAKEIADQATQYGEIHITDSAALTFEYTPEPGFRGPDKSGYLYLLAEDGLTMPGQINLIVTVINPEPKPTSYSLAVRGMGCIMCHAQITGTGAVVSDFGLGLKSPSSINFFFGNSHPSMTEYPYFGVYGDHQHSLFTAKIANDVEVIVPDADFPKSAPLKKVVDQLKTVQPSTKFTAARAIHIGAPTLTELQTIWENMQNRAVYKVPGVANALYFPDDIAAKIDVEGLKQDSATGAVYNDPNTELVCSGDILVKGLVRLTNVNLKSGPGCRIYATRTIFLDGPLSFARMGFLQPVSPKTQLQLASATAIVVGVGKIKSNDCATSTTANSHYQYCEGTHVLKARFGYFTQADDPFACKVTPAIPDTAQAILASWLPSENNFLVRDASKNTREHLLDIMRDSDTADKISGPGLGARIDSTCAAENSAPIAYKSLLLNAPYIQGRYSGLFSGLIIGENMMWSMDKLQIINDPIFTQVPLLPLLKFETILKVEK